MSRDTIKIALVGTHGTGKSVLAEAFAKEVLKRYNHKFYVIDGLARALRDSGYPINESGTKNTQLMLRKLYLEKLAECRHKNVISTETFARQVAYTCHSGTESAIRLEDFLLEELFYDEWFYMPIEFAVKEDTHRKSSTEFQLAIDVGVRACTVSRGVVCPDLLGSVEERVASIFSKLKPEFDRLFGVGNK